MIKSSANRQAIAEQMLIFAHQLEGLSAVAETEIRDLRHEVRKMFNQCSPREKEALALAGFIKKTGTGKNAKYSLK